MMKITGTYNEAIVYAKTVDESAIEQIRTMCSLPFLADEKIWVMPDVHAGAGCTIGTTMTVSKAVVPNFVGVDIGCGMHAVKIRETDIDLQKLDHVIHTRIPAGFNVRDSVHENISNTHIQDLLCKKYVHTGRLERSLGTLGGGNHFIELDIDSNGDYWLVIHSGSRHGGVEVANYYQNKAFRRLSGNDKEQINELIVELKEQGRQSEIQAAIVELKHKQSACVDKAFAYCEGSLLEEYMHDMEIMQEFAMENRKTMARVILRSMQWHEADSFTTIHNYIDMENRILRKGAVSAQEGEQLIIPMNMRDGSLICIGKGNAEWNCSAPHGAGRICSRMQAKTTFSMDAYRESMQGIYSSTVMPETIDEAPMAYKPMEEIMECIKDTCMIQDVIKPVYNFKAGD